MAVPAKIPHGLNFKKAVLGTINGLIDYLNSNWLQGGSGISIKRTPSGTIIELAKPKTAAPQSSGGSGSSQDLSVSVTGNTAFIGLSGSTATAQLVGTGDVEITGNTSGRIEIGVTGGTGGVGPFFPDYGEAPVSISADTMYPPTGTTYGDMWLIGQVGFYAGSAPTFPAHAYLKIYSSAGYPLRDITLFEDSGVASGYSANNGSFVSVCIPITHGYKFKVTTSGNNIDFTLNLYYV